MKLIGLRQLPAIRLQLFHPSDRRIDRIHICPDVFAIRGRRGPRRGFGAAGCAGVAEPWILAYSIFKIPYPRRLGRENDNRSLRPPPSAADDEVFFKTVV